MTLVTDRLGRPRYQVDTLFRHKEGRHIREENRRKRTGNGTWGETYSERYAGGDTQRKGHTEESTHRETHTGIGTQRKIHREQCKSGGLQGEALGVERLTY
jgi:hypothetical protein